MSAFGHPDEQRRLRPSLYDQMIDWPRRLQRELPLLRSLIDQVHATTVLDAACGTGRHAEALAALGLNVTAADVSAAMLSFAGQRLGPSPRVEFALHSFLEPWNGRAFDLVLCLGNSLSLAADHDAALAAVQQLIHATRPGGVCLVQVLNLWRLTEGPVQWQHVRPVDDAGQRHLLVKGVHRCGDAGFIDLLDVELDHAAQVVRKSALGDRFTGLHAGALSAAARDAGADRVELFGDYARTPYAAETSADLILLARRA